MIRIPISHREEKLRKLFLDNALPAPDGETLDDVIDDALKHVVEAIPGGRPKSRRTRIRSRTSLHSKPPSMGRPMSTTRFLKVRSLASWLISRARQLRAICTAALTLRLAPWPRLACLSRPLSRAALRRSITTLLATLWRLPAGHALDADPHPHTRWIPRRVRTMALRPLTRRKARDEPATAWHHRYHGRRGQ